MTDYSSRFQANVEQANYWNSEAGPKWVRFEAAMDVRLGPLTNELIQRATPRPGEAVLDVGCGAGDTTARMAAAVGASGRVLGIDISEPMLEAAAARCGSIPQVQFENADAQVHHFPDGDFDLLVSRFGVMFFSDPYAAFRNLATALRPGGRLHFVCWAPIGENPWFSVPLDVAKHHLGAPEPGVPRAPGPLAFSEPDYVLDILGKSGFDAVKVDPYKTTMASPESAEEQASFFMKLGPTARLISSREPDATTLHALKEDLVRELEKHQDNAVVSLGATVYYVSATR